MQDRSAILRTKLHRSPVPADVVPRQRLLELMNHGLQVPLTLVSAPAGYGKSLLVSHWADSLEQPCAWLSLEETENEAVDFLRYLVAAIHTILPEACLRTQALLEEADSSQLSMLSRHLTNELDAHETPFVLILDDYHRIRNSDVHGLLRDLLRHPPRCLRLVVVTRRDPPLSLASYRGRGQVVEVRLRDLQFLPAETSALLEGSAGISVGEQSLANLQRVVEGWAVGLRLVGLALRRQEDPEEFLNGLSGGIDSIQSYLMQEVMAGQEPGLWHRLMQISILDRFCAPMCEAVCAPERQAGKTAFDGQVFIQSLEAAGLFCVGLDAQGKWFRLHHLLQQVLQEQLLLDQGPEEVAALHARASRWLEQQGFVEEAVRHALTAGEPFLAAEAVKRHGPMLILREENRRLEKLLQQLPREIVDRDPWLLLFDCWGHQIRLQLPKWLATLEEADAVLLRSDLPAAEAESLRACFDALRSSYSFYVSDLDQALACSTRAFESVPREMQRLRIHAALVRGVTLQMLGRHQDAVSFLSSTLADEGFSGPLSQIPVIAALCTNYWLAARFDEVKLWSTRLEAISKEGELFQHRQWAGLYRSISLYCQNDLGEIEGLLRPGIENPSQLHTVSLIDQTAILAFTYQAQGRYEEAIAVADLKMEYSLKTGDAALLRIGGALRAELALRQGSLQEAGRWARDFEAAPLEVQYVFYLPELTLARYLVQRGTPGSRQEGHELLQHLEEFARRIHFRSLLIPVLALEAVVLDDQGDEAGALEKLAEAVAEADPGRGLRFFLDSDPRMAKLLRKLLRRNGDLAFVREILAGFTMGEQKPTTASPELIELLTMREEEVLSFAAKRLRDKEIAQELTVSPATVRYHLKNIYQKLAVHNRRAAVGKARDLGLIDPP